MKKIAAILIPVLGLIAAFLLFHHRTKKVNAEIEGYVSDVLGQLFDSGEPEGWKEELWMEEVSALGRYFHIEKEENQKILKELFQENYGLVEFEILEVVKSEEAVKVKINALQRSFFTAADEKAKELWQEMEEKNGSFEYQSLTEEEYREVWEEEMMEAVREAFKNGWEQRPVKAELHIRRKENGVWEIPQEDLAHLYQKVFSFGTEGE